MVSKRLPGSSLERPVGAPAGSVSSCDTAQGRTCCSPGTAESKDGNMSWQRGPVGPTLSAGDDQQPTGTSQPLLMP